VLEAPQPCRDSHQAKKKENHATILLALVSREATRRGEPKDMNTDCSSGDNSFGIYPNSWDMFHTDEREGRADCSSSDAEDSALYKVPGSEEAGLRTLEACRESRAEQRHQG